MLLYYIIFFIASAQLNVILVKSSDVTFENSKIVYCEVDCLDIENLSYNTCVIPEEDSEKGIDWNKMKVYEKGSNKEKIGAVQGLLHCKNEPYPESTVVVTDFPKNQTYKEGHSKPGCLNVYHQIYDIKLSENPKNCTVFMKEQIQLKQ